MNTIKESQSNKKGRLVDQLELQKNQHELCNTKSNTKFNIQVTMIIKSKSETTLFLENIKIIAFHSKNYCNVF